MNEAKQNPEATCRWSISVRRVLISAFFGGVAGMLLANVITFTGRDAQIEAMIILASIGAAVGVGLEILSITSDTFGLWKK